MTPMTGFPRKLLAPGLAGLALLLAWTAPASSAGKDHPDPYAGRARPAAAPAAAPEASVAAACDASCGSLAWDSLAPLLVGLEGMAIGQIGGRIYVSHGLNGGDNAGLRAYDIGTNTWSVLPGASFIRSELSGAAIGDRLYAVGGRNAGVSSVLEIYDAVSGTWSIGPPMPTARAGTGSAVLNDRLHVIGGRLSTSPNAGLPVSAHEVFDPVAGVWSVAAPLPTAAGDVYATAAAGGKIHVFGGYTTGVIATTQIYDPVTNTWSAGAPMPTARSNAIAGVLGGRIAVIGGLNNALQNLSVVEVYDPATDTWCTGPSKPTPSSEMGASAVTASDGIHAVGSGPVGASQNFHERLRLTPETTPPDITCPPDLQLECPADPNAIETWRQTATATDTCSAAQVASALVSHTPGCGGTFTDVYEFTATDAAGNQATCTASVVVSDPHGPALSGVPGDTTASCDAVPAAPAVTASDACDGAVPVSFDESVVPGNCPDSYTIVRTWTATDACGNGVSAVQTIQVVDGQGPVLAGVPDDTTASCNDVPPAPAVTATDDCAPPPQVAFSEQRVDGNCPDSYQLVRTWTATDRCGNTTTATRTVTVADTTPPVPTAALVPLGPASPQSAASARSSCSAPASAAFRVECGATDDCDPSPETEARLLVTRHVVTPQGGCAQVVEAIAVACGDVVEIRLQAPPCPARPPRSAASPASPGVVAGESVRLEVTATDRCGNQATATADPTEPPAAPCDDPLPDGTCCAPIGQPAPGSCPVPVCGGTPLGGPPGR